MRQINYNCSSGYKSQPPGYSFQSLDYEHFQLIFVNQGNLYFTQQNNIQSLAPGTALLLRPGGKFKLSCGNIGYSGIFFSAYNNDPLAIPGLPLVLPATSQMTSLAQMMKHEINHACPDSQHILNSLGRTLSIYALNLATSGACQRGKNSYGKYWAESARQALEASLQTGKGAREILAPMPLSYRQLARYFAALYSTSPKQYLVRAKMREAKRLLSGTDLPITVIAYELHFASSQHFATQFTKHTGISPSSYQKKALPET